MVSFESFVKAMPPSLSELKVLPSFCFAFKIPDDVAASSIPSSLKSKDQNGIKSQGPFRGHNKKNPFQKGSFHFDHISKKGTFHFVHIPKRAHSILSKFEIPKTRYSFLGLYDRSYVDHNNYQ